MSTVHHHGLSVSKSAPDSPSYTIRRPRLDGRGPDLATVRRVPGEKKARAWNLRCRGELMGSFRTLRDAMTYLTHSITGRAFEDCRFCAAETKDGR